MFLCHLCTIYLYLIFLSFFFSFFWFHCNIISLCSKGDIQDSSGSSLWPRKHFKHFTDDRIHHKLVDVCKLLGKYGEYNKLKMWSHHVKTFLKNFVVAMPKEPFLEYDTNLTPHSLPSFCMTTTCFSMMVQMEKTYCCWNLAFSLFWILYLLGIAKIHYQSWHVSLIDDMLSIFPLSVFCCFRRPWSVVRSFFGIISLKRHLQETSRLLS